MAGYSMTKDDLQKRLRRIEGQVRGLQRMIDEDTYCIDVLTQVSATTSALQSVAIGLLDEHLRHCVTEAVAAGGPEGRRQGRRGDRGDRTAGAIVTATEPARARLDLPITGMTCASCAAKIEKRLNAIDGVRPR